MSQSMKKIKEIEKKADKAAKEEMKLMIDEHEFALQNAEFAKFLKAQKSRQLAIDKMWNEVKYALIEAGYTDVIENEHFRISLTKVPAIKVTDVEALPKEFTEVVKVPKTQAIKDHIAAYDELPSGVVDNSYYRLNKKVK